MISTLGQTLTWSYLRHNVFLPFVQKLAHDTLSLHVEHAFPGVHSWYTNDKLMVHHHQPQHFLTSHHKNTTLSQLCHKLQKRTSVKMNLEQNKTMMQTVPIHQPHAILRRFVTTLQRRRSMENGRPSTAQEH